MTRKSTQSLKRSFYHSIVSSIEWKSHLAIPIKVERKTAQVLADAAIILLKPLAHQIHTISVDIGMENIDHEGIAGDLGPKIYFAHPYISWECATNERSKVLNTKSGILQSSVFCRT